MLWVYGSGPGLADGAFSATCTSESGLSLPPQLLNFSTAVPFVGAGAALPPGTITLPALSSDKLSLPDGQLIAEGYPLRPDVINSPQGYAQWLKRVSKPTALLPAKALPDPDRKPGVLNYSQDNWAGIFLPRLAPTDVFEAVMGTWNQPDLTFGWPHIVGTDYLYTWVGLDGGNASQGGSADCTQAGTAVKTTISQISGGWASVASYFAWAEWYPDNPVVLPNFTVTAGNTYYTEVWMSDSTGTSVQPAGYMWYYVTQEDEGPSIRGCIGPSGCTTPKVGVQSFVGDTAEWEVEKPVTANDLLNFNNVVITGADAFLAGFPRTVHSDGTQNYNLDTLWNDSTHATEANSDNQFSQPGGDGRVNVHFVAPH